MGKNRATATAAEATNWSPSTRTSQSAERYLVDLANWSALARLAKAVWKIDDRVQSISTLAETRGVEARVS